MHTRPGRILEARVDGTLSQAYVHATGLKDEIRENDNVVFEQKPVVIFNGAGEALHMHGDDLDNTLALTDSGGSVLERYAYDDYGQPQFLAADGTPLVDSGGQPLTTSSLGNPFLFHGKEWDGETGLLGDGGGDYFDPRTGRAVRGKVKIVRDTGSGVFSDQTRETLKDKFLNGDIPTQDQFGTLIDSTVNRLDDRYLIGLRVSGLAGNNPWSGSSPGAMKKGTVKFFNDAKGFGMVVGPGGGGPGYWSAKASASGNMTLKGQKILQN